MEAQREGSFQKDPELWALFRVEVRARGSWGPRRTNLRPGHSGTGAQLQSGENTKTGKEQEVSRSLALSRSLQRALPRARLSGSEGKADWSGALRAREPRRAEALLPDTLPTQAEGPADHPGVGLTGRGAGSEGSLRFCLPSGPVKWCGGERHPVRPSQGICGPRLCLGSSVLMVGNTWADARLGT